MSGISSRTVFYEVDQRKGFDGVYRFHDWNTVNTVLGTMMEPSQMGPRPAEGGQLDWDDNSIKFTNLKALNTDNPHLLTDSSDGWLHGYNLWPRSGR